MVTPKSSQRILRQETAVKAAATDNVSDSGFESFKQSSKPFKLSAKNVSHLVDLDVGKSIGGGQKTVPYDVSFVGGVFTFKLFHHKVSPNPNTCPKFELKIYSFQQNKVADVKPLQQRFPLFAVSLYQPNLFVSQSVLERVTQLSLFDLNITLGAATVVKGDDDFFTDIDTEFNDVFFQTRAGNPSLNGIPAPLLHCRQQVAANGELCIRVQCQRRVRLRVTTGTLEKLLAIRKVVVQFSGPKLFRPVAAAAAAAPILTSKKLKIIQNAMLGAQKLFVSIDNVYCDFSSDAGSGGVVEPFNVGVSFDNVTCGVDILQHPHRAQFTWTIRSFRLNTGRHVVVSPLSAQVAVSLTKEIWKRDLLVSCSVRANCIDISVTPHSILDLQSAQRTVADWTERFMATEFDDGIGYEDGGAIIDTSLQWWRDGKRLRPSLVQIPTPHHFSATGHTNAKDEHYQDDLR